MQVPARFEYERASSVGHALMLLERLGPEARVVAGGHSLIPMMKLRLAQPEALVDINDLAELSHLAVEGDELVVGALVRHARLLADAEAGRLFPILHDAERVIADPVVRNRGTVGGSLCQADPSEDLSAAFSALRATAVIQGPGGARTVPIREFHTGPYETAVEPGELLTELRVPIRPGSGSAYQKVERRVGDWPVAAAGAVLVIHDGVIAEAGIGLTAVGAAHFAAPEAEESLIGQVPGEEAYARAGALAAAHCEPQSDQRGPADYKRHLVGELVRRALARAAERAGRGGLR
ncbi:carbon-monoxide dehydrogenase medium subunit [Thermocatellispora tengchongensis]|uniref:Carbon-monoxide dehydrogenase medium subunit n=1 Tax=Thermocatellispora tengchongensis TaxID=1073253 RepID=A0A840P4X2_9ACTN|nr:xanthine dehydrogenase family protein subunit M [Thermocatellispora tengchongensis]MBB5131085.1 carbon-monoxide dehydrogenase medium subunit [Thermocatellispora tengchongensis]